MVVVAVHGVVVVVVFVVVVVKKKAQYTIHKYTMYKPLNTNVQYKEGNVQIYNKCILHNVQTVEH